MMLFQSMAVVIVPSAKGEIIIHSPRITLAQLHPDCRGVLVRMSASIAMTMPTITLFHIAAGSRANWTTNGEMITQTPNKTFTQFAPPALGSDAMVLMVCRLFIFFLLSKCCDLQPVFHRLVTNGSHSPDPVSPHLKIRPRLNQRNGTTPLFLYRGIPEPAVRRRRAIILK